MKWGAGLRASQALILGGKARALMHGRHHVSVKDIQALAQPILRHRIVTNFYAESERLNADGIVDATARRGAGAQERPRGMSIGQRARPQRAAVPRSRRRWRASARSS